MLQDLLARSGEDLSLNVKWITKLDGLVRVPIVDPSEPARGYVVVYAEKRRAYEVVCFDSANGDLIWKSPVINGGYGSPCICGDLLIVLSEFIGVQALKKSTGEPVWDFKSTSRVRSSIAVAQGNIIFSSGNQIFELDQNGLLVHEVSVDRAFFFGSPTPYKDGWISLATVTDASGSSEIGLYKLSRDKTFWYQRVSPGNIASSDTSGIFLRGDTAVVSGVDRLVAIDLAGETVLWEFSFKGYGQRHSCLGDENVIVTTTIDGAIIAVNWHGEMRWMRDLTKQGLWAPPSFLGDRIAAVGGGVIHLLSKADGSVVHTIPVGQTPYSALTFGGEMAFIGGGDPPYWGLLFGFDVTKDSRLIHCSLTQQKKQYSKNDRIEIVVSIGTEKNVLNPRLDLSVIGAGSDVLPTERDGNRFTFRIDPASGYRWGNYALPLVFELEEREITQSVLLELDDSFSLPQRVLLHGYDNIKQEEPDWSGAALIAAVRTNHGDGVDQRAVREMVDEIKDRSGYLPFDVWRIIARRAMSSSAKTVAELPEFSGTDSQGDR